MELIGKTLGVIQITGATLFAALLLIAVINTALTGEPPRPDQETWICNDGNVQPPALNREGCLHRGGLDHMEDRRP